MLPPPLLWPAKTDIIRWLRAQLHEGHAPGLSRWSRDISFSNTFAQRLHLYS